MSSNSPRDQIADGWVERLNDLSEAQRPRRLGAGGIAPQASLSTCSAVTLNVSSVFGLISFRLGKQFD